MSSHRPRISVVMPVYNARPYVAEAIESILRQTFIAFEFLIIDDGSTDGSSQIIDAYAAKDRRIRVVRQENRGLITSLNTGCEMARGEYLARMDGDDISLPGRLQRQAGFLEDHPKVGVVGTSVQRILGNGEPAGLWRVPLTAGGIRWHLLLKTGLVHAATMIRRDLFREVGGYRANDSVLHAEDYDLWLRLSARTDFANLPQFLYVVRRHRESICAHHRREQIVRVAELAREHIQRTLGLSVPAATLRAIRAWFSGDGLRDMESCTKVSHTLQDLFRAFARAYSLSPPEEDEVRRDLAVSLCSLARSAAGTSLWSSVRLAGRAFQMSWSAPVGEVWRRVADRVAPLDAARAH
jgi:glycosyltransferase involved in cell wall biosynthesis